VWITVRAINTNI